VHESDLVATLDRSVMDHLDLTDRHVNHLTDGLPHGRVVHVANNVQVGPAKRPRPTLRAARRLSKLDASRHLSPVYGLTVDIHELRLNAHGMSGRIHRDPEHRRLEHDVALGGDVSSPLSPRRAHSRTPRR